MKALWEEFRMILALNLLSCTISVIPKTRAGLEIVSAIKVAIKRQIDREIKGK